MSSLIPSDRLFTKDHEWIKDHKEYAQVGITEYAQRCLGDVVYVELPKVGTNLTKGEPLGAVESIKSVSDIYAPTSGLVIEINKEVIEHPELVNQDPYGKGWLLKIVPLSDAFFDELLNHDKYKELVDKESKH